MYYLRSFLALLLLLAVSIQLSSAQNSTSGSSRRCSSTSRSINGCTENCRQCCTNGVCESRTCTFTGCTLPLPSFPPLPSPQPLPSRQPSCREICRFVPEDRCFKKCNTCTNVCGPCFNSFRECRSSL